MRDKDLVVITEKNYDNKLVLGLIFLAALCFAFNLMVAPHLIASMPITAYRVTRDGVNLALVLPVLLLGLQRIEAPHQKNFFTSTFFIIGACIFAALAQNYYRGSIFESDLSLGNVGGKISEAESASPYILAKILVITPVIEEIVFRLAFVGMLSKFVGRLPSLVISSLLFAVAHLTRVDWIGLPPYFLSGLMYGITFILFGLRWSILLHILSNCLSYAVAQGYYAQAMESNAIFLPYFIIITIGFVVMVKEIFNNRREFISKRCI